MTGTEKKSKRSTRSTKPKFTEAHGAVLSGLVASKMRCWDCFKIIMALKTEKQAVEMLRWIYCYVKENGDFPSHLEMMRKAKANPSR